LGPCDFSKTLTGYSFVWPDTKIRINVDRVDDDGVGQFACWHDNGQGPVLLHISKENLMSTVATSRLANVLKTHAEIEWKDILTYVAAKTMEQTRAGEPMVKVGGKPPATGKDYQVYPILEKGQPTTIYGPGASAKSLVAAYFVCLIQFNCAGVYDWFPGVQGNCLYLDWEGSEDDYRRRVWALKQGLGLTGSDETFYRPMAQPLVNDIYAVQQLVFQNKIDFVVIDSQMAASGLTLDQAGAGTQFYNALRSLKCTTLTIDHENRTDWKAPAGDSVGPYGTVVKYNRARSIFQVRKSQNPGDTHMEISLVHRKHNEGKLMKPFGLRFNFEGDPLDMVSVTTCDLSQNEMLAINLTLADQIKNVLRRGRKTVKEMFDDTGIAEDKIRPVLHRHSSLFVKGGDGLWGLKSGEEDRDDDR
jgi:hypothetical protein